MTPISRLPTENHIELYDFIQSLQHIARSDTPHAQAEWVINGKTFQVVSQIHIEGLTGLSTQDIDIPQRYLQVLSKVERKLTHREVCLLSGKYFASQQFFPHKFADRPRPQLGHSPTTPIQLHEFFKACCITCNSFPPRTTVDLTQNENMASLAQEVLTTHEPFLLAVLPSFINRYIQCGYDERLFHIVMAQSYSNLENSQALVNEQASQRWVSWLAAGIEHALYEQQATLPKFCNALEAKIEPSALVDYAASKQLEDPKTIQLILPQLIGRLRADLEVYKRELPDHTAQPNKQAKEKEEKAQPEAIAIQPLSSSPKRRAN